MKNNLDLIYDLVKNLDASIGELIECQSVLQTSRNALLNLQLSELDKLVLENLTHFVSESFFDLVNRTNVCGSELLPVLKKLEGMGLVCNVDKFWSLTKQGAEL